MSDLSQASYRLLSGSPYNKVEIIPNLDLPVTYCHKTKGISKYKKVSKEKKQMLLALIQNEGESIIGASRQVGINYSTAKSIVLNHKKQKHPESDGSTVGGSCDGQFNKDSPERIPMTVQFP